MGGSNGEKGSGVVPDPLLQFLRGTTATLATLRYFVFRSLRLNQYDSAAPASPRPAKSAAQGPLITDQFVRRYRCRTPASPVSGLTFIAMTGFPGSPRTVTFRIMPIR